MSRWPDKAVADAIAAAQGLSPLERVEVSTTPRAGDTLSIATRVHERHPVTGLDADVFSIGKPRPAQRRSGSAGVGRRDEVRVWRHLVDTMFDFSGLSAALPTEHDMWCLPEIAG